MMSGASPPDDPMNAVSTSHLLHRAQQLASDRFALLVGENGVTLRQFVVMSAIADTPGRSQIDLVRTTGIDRSTLADVLTRLERGGFVSRSASLADARANVIDLTSEGAATLAAARQHAKAADAAILDALPRTKRRAFMNILLRLSEHADALAKQADRELKREARRQAKLKAKERDKERAKAPRKQKRKEGAR